MSCYGCQERTAECHASCKSYADFQRENEKRKAERHQAGEPYRALRDYREEKHKRLTRRKV